MLTLSADAIILVTVYGNINMLVVLTLVPIAVKTPNYVKALHLADGEWSNDTSFYS